MLENLKAATFEVFETMFFLFPESLEEAGALFTGAAFQAWVPITGPKSFQVGLTVPHALAQKMATNFLGLEEDGLPGDKLEDVIREAANMVAGNFIGREGVSAAFRMEAPRSQRLDFATQAWRPHTYYLLFTLADGGLEIFLERTN